MFETYKTKKKLAQETGIKGIYQIYIRNNYCKRGMPKMIFFAEWMEEMGFIHDTLVQFLPENDGLSFTLCENVSDYRTLVQQTQALDGCLVETRGYYSSQFPTIHIGSLYIERTGLQYGDALCVRYEEGFIRMRRLPNPTDKIVSNRLAGKWFTDLGFISHTKVKIITENGMVSCFLHTGNDSDALPVRALVNYRTKFEVPSSYLNAAGLGDEKIFLASCSHGLIRLEKLDFKALGF